MKNKLSLEPPVEGKQAGSQLADGFFFVIWNIKADLDHLAKAFGLTHYASRMPCCLCPCQAGKDAEQDMKYNNFTTLAKWLHMQYTHGQWKLANQNCHWLFQLPYLSAVNVDPDELHALHLGVSAYFLGSVLFILCFQILAGSPSDNLNALWKMIVDMYRRLRTTCQFTNLTLNMFCNTSAPDRDYPKLKGKGAEIKDLVEPLHLIWSRHMRPGNHDDELVQSCLLHLCRAQNTLHDYTSEPFLPLPIAREFKTNITKLLQNYSLLANSADRQGLVLFAMVPKHHYVYHLGDRASYLNPRRGNTMVDEDHVGKIKEVVASCAHGTESHHVPTKFMEKYQWGKHMEYHYGF